MSPGVTQRAGPGPMRHRWVGAGSAGRAPVLREASACEAHGCHANGRPRPGAAVPQAGRGAGAGTRRHRFPAPIRPHTSHGLSRNTFDPFLQEAFQGTPRTPKHDSRSAAASVARPRNARRQSGLATVRGQGGSDIAPKRPQEFTPPSNLTRPGLAHFDVSTTRATS